MTARPAILLLFFCAVAAAQVQVGTRLGARSCVLGEPMSLSVEVTVRVPLSGGAPQQPADPPRPTLPSSEDYDVEFVSSGTDQRSALSIFNGRRSGYVDHVTTFLYRVKARRTGRITVPSWEYELDGTKHRVAARTFLVEREAPGNKYVSVIVVASNDRPYVNQPVKIRYQLDTEKLILDRDEQSRRPEIDIPWAQVPNGAWATPFTELEGNRSARGRKVVLLNENQFGMDDVEVAGSETQRLVFERTIYPLAPGRLDLGGTSTRIAVATRFQRGVFGGLRPTDSARVVVNTEPLVLEVRDAPITGRPASYTGVIGDFTGDARLSEGEIRAGDGVTLTLELTGRGALESIEPPELSGFEEFDVYDPDREVAGEGERRTLTFSWLLVPKSTDVAEVPRFEFSWFKPSVEKFETVAVGPQALEISGEVDAGGIFESTITARRAAEIRTVGEGVRPLKESPGRLTRGGGAGLGLLLAIAIVPLLSLAATSVLVGRRRRLAGDESLVRRKRASKDATARLAEARALVDAERGFHGKLARCLSGFIGDKLGVPAASVSAATVAGMLEAAGVAAELVTAAAEVLGDLDVKEFGGGSEDESARREDLARVEKLIGGLDKVLKS